MCDPLGTVRDLAVYDAGDPNDPNDDATTVVSHVVYDGFGRKVSETAAVDHLFAFTGRLVDEATGLQNHLNRWYDPSVGRWFSEDPIEFEGRDFNLYRYVHNAPTIFTDPFGLTEGIPIPGGGTIHIDGETMGTATPHVQYGVAPNQTKIQIPATMTDVDDLTTLPGINKSLMKKLLKNPSVRQKLQNQLNNARGKCGLAGIVLTIALAAPEVTQAGQEGGLPGAASAAGNVAVGTAVAAGESVAVGGAIMGGASLAGTSITTGAGVAYVGIGGAATVGGAATLAGGVGLGIGYGIGSIPIGSHTIHEHLGEGMYWVGQGVYVGGAAVGNAASSAWNWITDW